MGSLERVYTGTECREIDRIAIEELGIPGLRLMQRAARFTMTEMLSRWPTPKSVSIVCGGGNNASDGYLLGCALQDRRIPVQIHQIGDVLRLQGDAKIAFDTATDLGLSISQHCDLGGEIVVDALLGTGVRGEVRANYAEAIAAINASGKPIVALDLPSGIDADTGGFLTESPVKADLTTCFVGRKLALLTGRARNVAGEVVSSSLQIPHTAFQRHAGLKVLPTCEAERRLPPREPSSHKGNFGHVLIVGGDVGMAGAVLLAGEASFRAGAGLVSVLTNPVHVLNVATYRPELMVHSTTDGGIDQELLDKVNVVAVGPGLGRGEWARGVLKNVLACEKPLIVDADALNLLELDNGALPPNSIVSPHPGEAARLLDTTTAEVEQNRPAAVKAITALTQGVGVLKGAGSLIANNGELQALCDIAEPALSTAGSGDVLTGVIAGVYAQLEDSLLAASLGVYLHAQAGQRAWRNSDGRAVMASEIADSLRPWH